MFRKSVILALVASASAFSTGGFLPALRPAQQRALAQRSSSLHMSCPLTPMGANVIVTVEEKKGDGQKSTESGILIAATVEKTGPATGVIAAVGNGWTTESGVKIPLDEVAVGDKIMFREPQAMENRKMKMQDTEYYVISVNDILAKIN